MSQMSLQGIYDFTLFLSKHHFCWSDFLPMTYFTRGLLYMVILAVTGYLERQDSWGYPKHLKEE